MKASPIATESEPDRSRRRLLQGLASGIVASACARQPSISIVDDVSQTDPIVVDSILRPHDASQIQTAIARSNAAVSIGGACHSTGGQIAAEHSLHLDMRSMNRLLALDPARLTVRVQSGMSWRDLQDAIDPHDLAVKVMQSYSNFTIGGSISVNCHGRYVGRGPIINTVRALQLVDASGQVRELSRAQHSELFCAVIGGYGGLGVVTEVELDLERNCRIERRVERCGLGDYPAFFEARIAADPDVLMHNADLVPPDFDAPLSTSWRRTQLPLTEQARLVPRDLDYSRDQNLIWIASELPGNAWLREHYVTDQLLHTPAVVWRNHEASLDTRSLEPRTRRFSTYLLQEYFVPVGAFLPFAQAMQRILTAHAVNALNVSIRHSPADGQSLLRWARTEVFSFVLYYKVGTSQHADNQAGIWTRELIDAAIGCGGRYYLPYRLHANRSQFERAYPGAVAFAAIKREVDPGNRFRNRLWDKYLPARS